MRLSLVKFPVRCPHCGKEFLESVASLIAHDEIACGLCSKPIDLTAEPWRSYVNEIAQSFSHIRAAYQKLPKLTEGG